MIIYTQQVLVKVEGDDVYKTLALAIKRVFPLSYLHHYLKILCPSFWREENLLSRLAFSFKKCQGSSFCRQNPGPRFSCIESPVLDISRQK